MVCPPYPLDQLLQIQTTADWKYLFQKVPKSKIWICHAQQLFRKHLHCIYKLSADNFKYTGGCTWAKCKCYANLHKDLRTGKSGNIQRVSWNQSPTETKGQLHIFLKGTAPNALFWFFLCNYANKYPAEKGLVLMDNQRQCFLPVERWEKTLVAELQGWGVAAGGPRDQLVSTLRVCWSGGWLLWASYAQLLWRGGRKPHSAHLPDRPTWPPSLSLAAMSPAR